MGLPPAMLNEDFRSQTQKPRKHEGVLDEVSSKDRPRTGDGEGEGGSRGVEMLEQHQRMAALVLSTPLTFLLISCSPVGHQRPATAGVGGRSKKNYMQICSIELFKTHRKGNIKR